MCYLKREIRNEDNHFLPLCKLFHLYLLIIAKKVKLLFQAVKLHKRFSRVLLKVSRMLFLKLESLV